MPRRNYLALAMIGSMGLFCWQATHGGKPKDEMLELYGLFVDAVEKVEANYVRPVSRRELLESALEGMLQHLDPHSTFINTSDSTQFRRRSRASSAASASRSTSIPRPAACGSSRRWSAPRPTRPASSPATRSSRSTASPPRA